MTLHLLTDDQRDLESLFPRLVFICFSDNKTLKLFAFDIRVGSFNCLCAKIKIILCVIVDSMVVAVDQERSGLIEIHLSTIFCFYFNFHFFFLIEE